MLQPFGDADCVAIDVASCLGYLAPVNADPEQQRLLPDPPERHARQVRLEGECEADRLLARGEKGEDAVAYSLNDPSAVIADQALAEVPSLEDTGKGARLIARHEQAEAVHVREQDGGTRPRNSLRSFGHAEGLW